MAQPKSQPENLKQEILELAGHLERLRNSWPEFYRHIAGIIKAVLRPK